MYQIAEQLLSLSNEAAIFVRHSKIAYANAAAELVLGRGCAGSSVRTALGPELAGAQAASFVADVPIGGKRYAVRVSPAGDGQAYFLSPADIEPPTLDDDMISAMRSILMSINLSCTLGRARVEQLGDDELNKCFIGTTRAYYMLTRILSNTSMLAGLIAGTFPFQATSIDLTELCLSIVASVREIFSEVELRTNFPQEAVVYGDRALLQQAILNLLSNCFGHASGLSCVSISLLDCSDRVVLSVTDDGCGIEQAVINSVFNKPCNEEPLRISRGARTGLDLVRAVAQRHKGSVIIESRPERGTTVRLSLSKGILPASAFFSHGQSYSLPHTALYTGLADCLPEDYFKAAFHD